MSNNNIKGKIENADRIAEKFAAEAIPLIYFDLLNDYFEIEKHESNMQQDITFRKQGMMVELFFDKLGTLVGGRVGDLVLKTTTDEMLHYQPCVWIACNRLGDTSDIDYFTSGVRADYHDDGEYVAKYMFKGRVTQTVVKKFVCNEPFVMTSEGDDDAPRTVTASA